MEANNTNPASLIPTSQLGTVAQNLALGAKKDSNVMAAVAGIQAQLDAILNKSNEDNLPDVVLVNPFGRIVAVSGRNSAEYMAKAGFRKATPEEEEAHNRSMLYQTQEFLKRVEAKRIRDEKKLLDSLEEEGELEKAVNPGSLLRAKITPAQKTGALEPSEVAKLNTTLPVEVAPSEVSATLTNDTGSSDNKTQIQSAPPSRKVNKSTNTSK